MKLLAKKWGELITSDRKYYHQLAETDQKRYKKDMAQYQEEKELDIDNIDNIDNTSNRKKSPPLTSLEEKSKSAPSPRNITPSKRKSDIEKGIPNNITTDPITPPQVVVTPKEGVLLFGRTNSGSHGGGSETLFEMNYEPRELSCQSFGGNVYDEHLFEPSEHLDSFHKNSFHNQLL